MGRRRHPISLSTAAVLIAIASASAISNKIGAVHPDHWRGAPPNWLAHNPLPPPPGSIPPATLQLFWHFWTTYQLSKADGAMPFPQWLLANGVDDPRLFATMVWLYHRFAADREVG